MKQLTGIIIPLITPFDGEGRLRLDMLRRNIEKWNATDISGYMCLGSNGEFKSLSDEESLLVIQTVAACKDEHKLLIAGVGRESQACTLAFIRALAPLYDQIDYLSVITPGYFSRLMTDEALYAYYTSIADQSPLPVLLYTAPSYANHTVISPALLNRLAGHKNIVGIKDTTPDMMERYMDVVSDRRDFSVIAGSINNLLRCLERGGRAGVVSAANYFPAACARIVALYESGDKAKACALQEKIRFVVSRTAAMYGVAGVKACMGLLGYEPGIPRLPVLPVSPREIDEMKPALLGAELK